MPKKQRIGGFGYGIFTATSSWPPLTVRELAAGSGDAALGTGPEGKEVA